MTAETVAFEGGEWRAGGDLQRLAALGERRRHSLRGLFAARRQPLHAELREQRLHDRHAPERSRSEQRRQAIAADGVREPRRIAAARDVEQPPVVGTEQLRHAVDPVE